MKWTTALKNELIHDWNTGLTYEQLAKKYSCSKSTVSKIISEIGPVKKNSSGKKNHPGQDQKKITKNIETGQDAAFVRVPIAEYLSILKLLRMKKYANPTLQELQKFVITYLEGLL